MVILLLSLSCCANPDWLLSLCVGATLIVDWLFACVLLLYHTFLQEMVRTRLSVVT